MRDGAATYLRLGLRDEFDIASRLAQTCGIPLGRFMVRNMGFTPDGAANYVVDMGRQAVRDAGGAR